MVESVKRASPTIITRRRPNLASSQPVIGVTTAVARMLKVTTQAIWSWVADIEPCICGKITETTSTVVE